MKVYELQKKICLKVFHDNAIHLMQSKNRYSLFKFRKQKTVWHFTIKIQIRDPLKWKKKKKKRNLFSYFSLFCFHWKTHCCCSFCKQLPGWMITWNNHFPSFSRDVSRHSWNVKPGLAYLWWSHCCMFSPFGSSGFTAGVFSTSRWGGVLHFP